MDILHQVASFTISMIGSLLDKNTSLEESIT